jgi:anti-sigma-K factor RskA
MTHNPYDESVAAYAIGALDADERRAFETHLASCAQCAAELTELRKVTTGLVMSVDPEDPPADLKARTIARATAHPQARREAPAYVPPVSIVHPPKVRSSPAGWLAAAAALIIATGAALFAWSLRSELTAVQKLADDASTQADRLRGQLLTLRQDSARMAQTLSILSAPDTARVDLKGQGDLATATAQVYWSPTRGVLLMNMGGVPALDPGQVFELWAVPPEKGAAPLAAGLFHVDPAGLVTTVAPAPTLFPAADAFAVTVEPAGGSPAATTPIILIGRTKKG